MGHPASRTFEDDFKTLMDGGKITGAGTTASGDDSDSEAGEAGANIGKAISDFQTGVEQVKKDVDAAVFKKF